MVQPDDRPRFPFVGRANELAVGRRALDRAVTGRGGLLLVSGGAGIGKSRLASELAALSPGWQVLSGAAHREDADRAYGPLQEAFDRTRGAGDAGPWARAQARDATLAGVLTGLRLPVGHERPPLQNQPLAFDSLLEAMLGDRASPTLLLLEDLHLADDGTWDFVAHSARRLPELPLVVLVTHRAGERAGLERVLAMSERDHVDGLPLTGLPPADAATLARSIAPHLPSEALDEVVGRSAGSPLLVIELVGELLSEAPGGGGSPDPARDLAARLGERLARLRPQVRDRLELAAVVGARSPVWPLLSPGTTLGLLDEAAERGWLRLGRSEPLTYEFANDLRREVVEQGLSASRRRVLHAQVASGMERAEPDRLERLSFHWEAAGVPDRAVGVLETAIEDARRTGRHGRAASLGLTAWELVRRQPALAGRAEAACRTLLDDLLTCGRWTEMERVVRQRWESPRQPGRGETDRLALQMVLSLLAQARCDEVGAATGQEGGLLAVTGRAESAPDLLVATAWMAGMAGMTSLAAQIGETLAALSGSREEPSVVHWRMAAETACRWRRDGDRRAAAAGHLRGAELARRAGRRQEESLDLTLHGCMALDLHAFDRAERLVRRGGGWTAVLARLASACLHTLRGETGHAVRIYADLRRDVPMGAPFLAHVVDVGEAELLLHLGRLRDAGGLLSRERPCPSLRLEALTASIRAWLAWERGELARAAATFRRDREQGVQTGGVMLQLGSIRLPLEVDALVRLGRHEEAAAAVDAAAVAGRDLDPFFRAALAAARFRSEPTLRRAEEAVRSAQAAPYPWLEGQVRCWRAELLHERHQAELARRVFAAVAARAGVRRATTCAHRQGRPGGAAADGGLTSRQLELAHLVRAHLTNREIADRLCLSEHTVATHLHNIYATLGFKKRSELAEWVGSRKIHRSVDGRQESIVAS